MGKSLTQDEKFVLALYQMSQEQEEEDTLLDAYIVGQSIGMATRQVDAICTQLMRANFIKREDKHFVYLTAHGNRLAEGLAEEF